MNKGTTIQINSLEALERLIGGETELEISIRNSVVQNFVKKHLKAIADEHIVAHAENEIKKLVNDTIIEKVGSTYSSGTRLKEDVRKMITDQINHETKTVIRDMVSKTVIECSTIERINILIEDQAELIINSITGENLAIRLDKMVNQKLKEKLGI